MATIGDNTGLQARWRSYFEQILVGSDHEIAAAVDAAMAAVARGEAQQDIRAAGLAAAKRVRNGQAGANGTKPRPAAQPPGPSASAPSATEAARKTRRQWPPGSAVVYSIEKRSENLDGEFFQVWSFRLLRLENGEPVQPPIAVEIRGRAIIGQLAKGDVVEIPPGRRGHTRLVKSLRNHSADAEILAKGRPFRRTRTIARTVKLTVRVLAALIALAILLLAAGAALAYFDIISLPR